MVPRVHLIDVFAAGPHGGNLAPIVIDANGMSGADMQDVARRYGHESGFVLPAPADCSCDLALRFWVPNDEMEMCGHATVGAVWLLDQLGRLSRNRLSIWTRSGRVDAHVTDPGTGNARGEITQPRGHVEELANSAAAETEILSVLGITSNERAGYPIQNACTSRVKTLIPLTSAAVLDALRPDFQRVESLCERIGSTGLYPYALAETGVRTFDARQFPKSSGYPEDAATGIAAAALAFGLLANGVIDADDRLIRVRQGRAMGNPSEITLRFRTDAGGDMHGCWVGGNVRFHQPAETATAG